MTKWSGFDFLFILIRLRSQHDPGHWPELSWRGPSCGSRPGGSTCTTRNIKCKLLFKGDFLKKFFFLMYVIQHCFICRPLYRKTRGSNQELLRLWHLHARRSNQSARSYPEIYRPPSPLCWARNIFDYPQERLSRRTFKRGGEGSLNSCTL
jgi:hypothetical protein